MQEAIAIQIEGRLFARTKANPAKRCGDRARIVHTAADQADNAARSRLDGTRIGDIRGCAIAGEIQPACVEIRIADVEGRGDEAPANGNRATRCDGDPVRIDEIDLAVAAERASDGRRRRAGDAVEDRS